MSGMPGGEEAAADNGDKLNCFTTDMYFLEKELNSIISKNINNKPFR